MKKLKMPIKAKFIGTTDQNYTHGTPYALFFGVTEWGNIIIEKQYFPGFNGITKYGSFESFLTNWEVQ